MTSDDVGSGEYKLGNHDMLGPAIDTAYTRFGAQLVAKGVPRSGRSNQIDLTDQPLAAKLAGSDKIIFYTIANRKNGQPIRYLSIGLLNDGSPLVREADLALLAELQLPVSADYEIYVPTGMPPRMVQLDLFEYFSQTEGGLDREAAFRELETRGLVYYPDDQESHQLITALNQARPTGYFM